LPKQAQCRQAETPRPLVHEYRHSPGVRTPENTRGTSQKRVTCALTTAPMRSAVTRTLCASIHGIDTVY
jgi:hypothetical protein